MKFVYANQIYRRIHLSARFEAKGVDSHGTCYTESSNGWRMQHNPYYVASAFSVQPYAYCKPWCRSRNTTVCGMSINKNTPKRGKGVITMNKKNLFAAVAATAMAMTMSVSAFAADANTTGTVGGVIPTDNGTDVYAGVVVDDKDTRIKVTVPTTFAFVVNGTVDTTGADKDKAITVENGALLLPNVKAVDAEKTANTAKIATVGENVLKFENFSTRNKTAGGREGVSVKVTGSITNEGTADSRNGWTAIGTAPSTAANTDVKKYQLVVNKKAFAPVAANTFGMTEAVLVGAPDVTSDNAANLDNTTKLAKAGNVEKVTFDVKVGGVRGDYNKVENSAKVGTINWTVVAQ